MLNTVFLNGNTYNKVVYWQAVDKNVVTRGTQEPNLVFSLGAVVYYSLIKCSGSHGRITTVNDEN